MVSNKTTISQQKSGQLITTVPRAIAGAMKLGHKDQLEWFFDRGDLIVRKV